MSIDGTTGAGAVRVRRLPTADLSAREVTLIRRLLEAAFGSDEEDRFTEDDWQHALGGMHFLVEAEGTIVAHAAVVERDLHAGGRPLRTGYVEAVATVPGRQRTGLGSMVMREVASYIEERFELGALATGSHHFYERLGWQTWRGPTSVRTADGPRRTPEEDGYVLVRGTRSSPALDLDDPITCEWRPGDVW